LFLEREHPEAPFAFTPLASAEKTKAKETWGWQKQGSLMSAGHPALNFP